jgi:hypothetical protein
MTEYNTEPPLFKTDELFYNLFCVFFSWCIGVVTASTLVVHFVWTPLKRLREPEMNKIELYNCKYIDEIESEDACDIDELRLQQLSHCVVMETTPSGMVIMYYDHSTETFTYYASRSISTKFLETIARKYACMFHCKSLLIQHRITEEKNTATTEKTTENNTTKPKKNSIYATFKTYPRNERNERGSNKTESPSNGEKADVEPILANKFKLLGRVDDFKFLQSQTISHKTSNISFMDFMNNNGN